MLEISFIKKMKNFIKTTLAVVCGFVLTFILCMFVLGGMFSALLSSDETPVLPKEGVLVVNMSQFTLGEQSTGSDPASMLQGVDTKTVGIWEAVQAVNMAADDPAVSFIYLKPDGNLSSTAALEEFRTALKNFRQNSSKPVISFIESPSTGSYYMASVADKVYMSSYIGASTTVTGVSSQMIFLGDLLHRLGVNIQLIRHGKYKSAGEMYTRGSSSAENREQYQRLVDSMWETLGNEIAQSRGITMDELNRTIDDMKLSGPQDFVDCKLVDELLTKSELEEKLTIMAQKDKYSEVKSIAFADYVSAKVLPSKGKNKIAIIYANGEIVDGADKAQIAGDRFAALVSKVAKDSTVKAVVLRVNSPGGSVLASEKIKTELDLLKAAKPVIASYGDYAASGGYWISNNCDRIFSNGATLTGSIGVFGLVPDFSKAARDIAHVGVETVSSNKHGDIYGLMRPLDSSEYAFMLKGIEEVYEKFISTVSEGRSIPKETVDAIGQGRVWTGADALTINLVDEIGTLEDAIHYAAECAGDPDLSNWNIKAYPKPQTQMEQILSMLNKGTDTEEAMAKIYKDITSPKVLARMDTELKIK